jgi:hypothetical protein
MPFTNGHPKVGGRRKGMPNRATEEVRELARAIIEDPAYQKALRARLRAGEAAGVEGLLWRYAFGAPPQGTETATETMELKELLEQLWQQHQSAEASARPEATSVTPPRTPVPRDAP